MFGLALALRCAHALDPAARFQDYVLDNWNTDDGLPQVSVLSIVQDQEGYLWVGTQAELTRFDGVRFVVYDRRNTGGIDTSLVGSSLRDSRNRLWFGTPHGLLLYAAQHFQPVNAKGSGDSVPILGIAEAPDGTVLFATPHGVQRYQDGALVPDLPSDEPSHSLLRNNDALWIGLTGALVQRHGTQLERMALPEAAASARVTHLASSTRGLWVGTNTGLWLLRAGHFEPGASDPDLAHLNIESLFTDHDDNVWVATAAALYRIRPGGQIEKVDNQQFVSEPWVSSVFEDREHNLWLGSITESLFRLHNGWITHFNSRDGLPDRFTWSVVSDPHGGITIGSNSGVAQRDEQGIHLLVAGKDLPNPSAYELFYDDRGRLWIGTRSGLARYTDGRLDTPAALATLAPYQINAIVQTGPDDFRLGTNGGLYRFHGDVLSLIGVGPGSPAAHVRCIYVLGPDELLIGTETGLRHVRGDTIDTPDYARALDGVFVTAITQLAPRVIGIGTLNAGIGVLIADRLTLLNSDNGLPGNNAWSFRVVDGQVYAGSTNGVWRLSLQQLLDAARDSSGKASLHPEIIVSAIGRERPGQRTRCCNGGANSRSASDGDQLWFPTMNGPIRVNTPAITAPAIAPNVVIEGVSHHGEWHPGAAELELPGAPRDLEIQFTALYFHDPHSLRFRYRLEGYDDDWIDAGSRRSAYYTNLDPGTYQFHVRATNSAGGNSADATLRFTLPPRWHENALLRALALLMLLVALMLLWQWRTRSYLRRQKQLEVLVGERTNELRDANAQLAQANQALTLESNTDPLTGLRNRRFLLERMQQLTHGPAPQTLALLLIDMDDFKIINDNRGHLVGDRILQQFAQLLRDRYAEGDLIARWGGDEFLLVLHESDANQALRVAESIRHAITAHEFMIGEREVQRLRCSIGVALHPPFPDVHLARDWSVALELADMALARVKQGGGNRSAALVAGPGVGREVFRHNISASVPQLLASDELRIVLSQPPCD